MQEKYINPFTDFGFKKIFGEEANKDLLMDFLNELVPDRGRITDLTYLKSEQLGASPVDRKAVFDLYCQTDLGERFIVEIQKARGPTFRQKYFKDRSIYYATFPIQEQAQTGDWDFKQTGVYTIAVMDFIFEDAPKDRHKLRHDIQLMDIETHRIFFPKLRFIYLEMPKFTKTVDELETHYETWLYVLKNLSRLDRAPERLREGIFTKLFKVAEIAKYDEKERWAYQDSLKYYRDLKNVMDTATEEGFEEGKLRGIEEGRVRGIEQGKAEGKAEGKVEGKAEGVTQATNEIVTRAINNGLDTATIVALTGLSPDVIDQWR